MFESQLKLSTAALCFLLLSDAIPFHASAQATQQITDDASNAQAASSQSVPGQPDKIPQPGELGSPFSVDHFWKHIAFELGGGYSPVVQKGAGLFDNGFNVTAGVIDHLRPHWDLLAEAQFFGLSGSSQYVDEYGFTQTSSQSNTDFAFDLAAAYDLLSRARTSPYIIGGIGYYRLGDIPPQSLSPCISAVNCPLNLVNAAQAVGYNGGIGIRHRLYEDRRMEIFAEGRYHYIASSSTAFGQVSLFPISAGIRW